MKEMKNEKNFLAYIVAAVAIHRVPAILTGVILLVLVISASSSPAAGAKTYHGTFTGGEFFCDGTPSAGPTVTGTWNVSIDPATSAQVTLNVFYDGGHHLAFGNNALMLVSFNGGVYEFSGFGGPVTATLDTNVTPATFSWHVELGGGCPPQSPYNSLTYFGVASRGRG
jgi:hypothetical protein